MEKRKPERRDRTAAPRPAATPPAIRHRTATRPFRAEKMQLRRSKCTTYDDVAFNLPIVAFTLSGDHWSFTIFQSPTPVTAPILRTWRHYWPFRRSTCDLQSSARLLLSRFLAQSGVGSRELLLGLVTQVCALTPRTRYRLQPFPSARRLVADRAPLTPANFRSSLAGLPPPPA